MNHLESKLYTDQEEKVRYNASRKPTAVAVPAKYDGSVTCHGVERLAVGR